MAFLVLPLVLETVIEAVVVTGAVVTAAVVTKEVVEKTVDVIGSSSSSSSSSSSTTCFEKKTVYDWWCNGLTTEEKNILIDELGYKEKEGCFSLEHLKEKVERHFYDKEPGQPTKEDGYEPPKNWNGKLKKVGNSQKKGYPHKDGSIWVPTGRGTENVKPHGGPHWDVQSRDGKSYRNVYPKNK
ncbi:hypothetical protein Glove_300g9 [Diversispora epigaea]|uniref:Toxin 37-like C-terminal domain-containing protein n=1 Tax=Diversispora epigaea TaxID=1348612 RepID=A0A397I427_9GLOM|nr:hypothetical protein Glove_300g9 [Diversispora epigaea]